MKTQSLIAAVIGILITSCSARACPDDRWLAQDKGKHFATSAVLAAGVTAVTRSELTGFAVSFGLGLAKEAYDSRHPGRHCASVRDLAADALGAYVGAKGAGWIVLPQKGGFSFMFVKGI
jgi:uncharacterized protein YfiM (DUF2279 family)